MPYLKKDAPREVLEIASHVEAQADDRWRTLQIVQKPLECSRSVPAPYRDSWRAWNRCMEPLAAESILAAAAAHHRWLWIHPFADGNGRVARLMSNATLLEVLDTGSIWSIARGLARNAAAFCSGPQRKSARAPCRRSQVRCWKRFFSGENSLAATFQGSLGSPTGTRAGSSRRVLSAACSHPSARARR